MVNVNVPIDKNENALYPSLQNYENVRGCSGSWLVLILCD